MTPLGEGTFGEGTFGESESGPSPSGFQAAWAVSSNRLIRMIKNTASQKMGAQLRTASDGSAFTGSVTVYVTGDAGTQAVGSVSSGACTHEGNGYHTYAPAQAETNYDLIAFTFIGSGAIPETIQVETRLAAPAVNATQLAGQTITASAGVTFPTSVSDASTTTAIKAKTDNLPSDPADASDVAGQITAALTATIADSVPADGTRPSIASGIYMLVQFLLERSVSGTTCTVKKPDGSTSLFALTLDSATDPTAITRSA